MKNKTKKIPKTHLPKYGNGGDATSNLYNEKRKSNLSNDQWAAVAQGAASTGAAFSANQSLTGQDKTQADYNAINNGINSVAGAVTPWYTYAKAGSDLGRGMIARDENGKPVDKTNAQMDAVMKPHHEMITEDLSKGNTGLAIAELLLPGIGIESRSNSLGLSNTINKTLGVKNTDYMYAMGGMNIIPNARIEKEENVVAPNGGFYQSDSGTHESGNDDALFVPNKSMIFSDRLKAPGTKKTFADLNKINNTNKEDKILDSNKTSSMSKRTAELMKFVKNKNSETLFNEQEALKQAKVEAYAKKMGVNLNLSPEVPQEFAMGGVKLPMYPLGGPTDNTKFTPAQRQQAYADSMTLYKSGFNKNIPNWQAEPGFNDAVGRLHTLNGVVPQSTDKSATAYANDPNYLAKRSVPYAKPTRPVYEVKTEGKNAFVPTYPNYNMPMKGLERPDDFNPQLQTVPANRPSTIKTNIVTGPTMSYKEYKQGNEVLDRAYFDPSTKKEIETQGFKYGGRKLPKYEDGGEPEDNPLGYKPTNKVDQMRMQQALWNSQNKSSSSSWLTPEMMQTSSDALIEEGYTNPSSPVINTTPTANTYPIRRDKNGKLIFDTPTSPTSSVGTKRDQELYDAELARMNASGGRDSNKFDWKNTLGQVSNFAANNAGNIYNLSRYNKPEVERYERAKATLLDPTAAIRNAMEHTRRAEYNVRGASGGNAGTYLSNRVALNAQNINMVDAIRQQYANANAGISNNFAQYNNQLAMQEVIANAQNRARNRSGKGEAISQIGKNYNQQVLDTKKGKMEESMMQMLPKLVNDPSFMKFYEEYKKNNPND